MLMAGLREAIARGDHVSARRLEELIMRAVRCAGKETFLITLEREALDALHPGAEEFEDRFFDTDA